MWDLILEIREDFLSFAAADRGVTCSRTWYKYMEKNPGKSQYFVVDCLL
jgi:hypothetical protein